MSKAAVAFITFRHGDRPGWPRSRRAIREEHGNIMTQIFVRTGQPGIAPEREVIDRYDINGYFSKTEGTADKLYTFVKSGIRQYYLLGLGMVMAGITHALMETPARSSRVYSAISREAWSMTARGNHMTNGRNCVAFVEGTHVIAGNWSDTDSETLATHERLAQLPSVALGANGDTCVVDGTDFAISIGGSVTSAPMTFLAHGTAAPPPIEIPLFHGLARDFSTLWKAAG